MARAYDSDILVDTAGNVIANAVGTLYVDAAATTLATDAYAASSGGSPITTVTTDTKGHWEVWFDTQKSYWVQWADNGNAAYAANRPAVRLDWAPFVSKEHLAREKPSDEATDDASLAATVAGLAGHLTDTSDAHDASAISETGGLATVQAALDALRLSGTFASRPAAATAGRIFYATDQGVTYRDLGASWFRLTGNPKDIWATDYGWLCDDNPASASANVAAYILARADAIAAGTSTVIIPEAPGHTTAYVNAKLNYSDVTVIGVGGTQEGQFVYEPMVRIAATGALAASADPIFYVDNTGVGIGAACTLSHLYLVGVNRCVQWTNACNLGLNNCVLQYQATALDQNHALVMENSFLIRVGVFALVCTTTPVTSTMFPLGIYGSNGGPITASIGQGYFRDGVINAGGIYSECRRATGGGTAGPVRFENVITENQVSQAYFTHRVNGAGSYGLENWQFVGCQKADATGAGTAFFDFDFGTAQGNALNFKIEGGAADTYLIKTVGQLSLGGWDIDRLTDSQTLFDPTSSTTAIFGMRGADNYGGGAWVRGNLAATTGASAWGVGAADYGFRVGKAIGETHARGMWRASDGALSFGSGSAIHDTYLRRSAASTVTIDADGSGGAATLAVGTLSVTTVNGTTLNGTTIAGSTSVTGGFVSGTNSLRVGATPATAGDVRMPSTSTIQSRNAANNANLTILNLSGDVTQLMGQSGLSLITNTNVAIAFAPNGTSVFSAASGGLTMVNGKNIIMGTGAGSMIATATNQPLAFWGATPVARPSAYTQTYSTADKTLGAYTSDPESSAYTGAADGEAKLADLNSLRVAYENLRAFTEDLAAFTNAVVDDLQTVGLVG
jgi:hypothetical protein